LHVAIEQPTIRSGEGASGTTNPAVQAAAAIITSTANARKPIGVLVSEAEVLVPVVTGATMESDQVRLQSSIRAFDSKTGDLYLEKLSSTVERAAREAGSSQATEVPRYGRYPATRNETSMVAAGRPALERALGADNVIDAGPFPASEDFPWLTGDGTLPSLFILMGVKPEGGAKPGDLPNQHHTAGFRVDDDALPDILRAVGLLMSDMSARCAAGWKPAGETMQPR